MVWTPNDIVAVLGAISALIMSIKANAKTDANSARIDNHAADIRSLNEQLAGVAQNQPPPAPVGIGKS